jgi:hypothetical protein
VIIGDPTHDIGSAELDDISDKSHRLCNSGGISQSVFAGEEGDALNESLRFGHGLIGFSSLHIRLASP